MKITLSSFKDKFRNGAIRYRVALKIGGARLATTFDGFSDAITCARIIAKGIGLNEFDSMGKTVKV